MDNRLKKQLNFALEIDKREEYFPPDSFVWTWEK